MTHEKDTRVIENLYCFPIGWLANMYRLNITILDWTCSSFIFCHCFTLTLSISAVRFSLKFFVVFF